MRKQSKFYYKGPIRFGNTVLNRCWEGVTWAPSDAKALANLSYQYKKEKGLVVGTRVELNNKYLIEISAVENDYDYYDEEMRRIINESVQV